MSSECIHARINTRCSNTRNHPCLVHAQCPLQTDPEHTRARREPRHRDSALKYSTRNLMCEILLCFAGLSLPPEAREQKPTAIARKSSANINKPHSCIQALAALPRFTGIIDVHHHRRQPCPVRHGLVQDSPEPTHKYHQWCYKKR